METDRPRRQTVRRVVALAAAMLVAVASAPLAHSQAVTSVAPATQTVRDNGTLRIAVSLVTTKRGATVPVSPDYFLELNGNTVTSHLPYFGRSYMAPPNAGNVMEFTSTADSIASEARPGGAMRLSFRVRTDDDIMRFAIDIQSDGRTKIDVWPQRRDRISYDGELEEQ